MKTSFIGVLTQSPHSLTKNVLVQSSNQTTRNIYVLPATLLNGGHIILEDNKITPSTDLEDNIQSIGDLTTDIANLQTRVNEYEAGSIIKTITSKIDGTVRGPLAQEHVFTATSDVSAYINGLPELGLDATLSNFTPTENIILIISVSEDLVERVGTRNQFFRLYDQSTGDMVISAGWNQHSVTNIPFSVPLFAGRTYQLREFDSPTNEANFSLTRLANGYNTSISKYNNEGVTQWVAKIGGSSGFDNAEDGSISINSTGQIAFVATFDDPVSIYNADGSLFATLTPDGGNDDVVLGKYNNDGSVAWVARVASTLLVKTDFYADLVRIDTTGNVYIGGVYQGNGRAWSSDGLSSKTLSSNANFYDSFLVKYDTNGIATWAARMQVFNTNKHVFLKHIDLNNVNGDIAVFLHTTGLCTVDIYSATGPKAFSVLNPRHFLIVKYDNDGIAQWVARMQGYNTSDLPYGVSFHGSTGDISALSRSYNSLDVYNSDENFAFTVPHENPGGIRTFLVKYDTDGTAKWGLGLMYQDRPCISTDQSSGDIYVCGAGTGGNVYKPDGLLAITIPANIRGWVLKFNSSGEFQWYIGLEGGSVLFSRISTDSNGDSLISGYSSSDLTVYDSTGSAVAAIPDDFGFLIKCSSEGLVFWNTISSVRWFDGCSTNGTDNVGIGRWNYTGPSTVEFYDAAESYKWAINYMSTMLLR